MGKVVFVLGAGFSMEAGYPAQVEIMKEMFNVLHDKKWQEYKNFKKIRKFLTENYSKNEEFQKRICLEDVFTPLDRCLLDNISFRGLNASEVKDIKEKIDYLICLILKKILINNKKKYIDAFASYLFEECKIKKNGGYKVYDPVSVVSTNWDILLDSSLQMLIIKWNQKHKKQKSVLDYCCYVSSYKKKDENIKPGLEVLGQGGFNIKLIKLHGSLNWLQCLRCQRLYVDLNSKIALSMGKECRHCRKNFQKESKSYLSSNIIMPTFLKNLTNPQYRIIWQNAGIELSEASKIIFIGYSLPQADFEMRQLLARMVRRNAEIVVVNPDSELRDRYENFFGRSVDLKKMRVSDFVEKFISDRSI